MGDDEKQAAPAPGRERVSFWLKLTGLPVAVSLWVAARTLYYEGYADGLGVPHDISFTTSISVWSHIVSAVTAVMVLFTALVWTVMLFQAKRRLLRGLGIFCLFVFALAAVRFMLRMLGVPRDILDYVTNGVAAAALLGLLAWGARAIYRRVRPAKKIEAQAPPAEAPAPIEAPPPTEARPPQAVTAPSRQVDPTSAAIVGIISLVLVGAAVSRQWGKSQAEGKGTWVVVGHPRLPEAADAHWVLLGRSGADLLVARSSAGALHYPYVTVTVTSSERAVSFQPRKLGRLTRPKVE